jgi:hypothetical protein
MSFLLLHGRWIIIEKYNPMKSVFPFESFILRIPASNRFVLNPIMIPRESKNGLWTLSFGEGNYIILLPIQVACYMEWWRKSVQIIIIRRD